MESPRHPQDERGLWFARALTVLYLALVVHVTLVPAEFGVSERRFLRHLAQMVLALDPRHPSHLSLHALADLATNVLLYVPLGLLCAGAQRRPRRLGAGLGAAISLALEVQQAATWDRTASLLDVLANGAGHAAGYGVARWLVLGRGVSHAIFVGGKGSDAFAHLAGGLRSAYVLALLVLSLYPYDVTVSAGRLWSKALGDGSEPGRIHAFLATPWDGARLAGVVLVLSLSAAFGALSWLAGRASARPAPAAIALQGLAVAGLVEAGQVVVASRTADVAQVFAGAVGAAFGAALARRFTGAAAQPSAPGSRLRAALLVATTLWILVLWTEAWRPFAITPSWQDAARKLVFESRWIPSLRGAPAPWWAVAREAGLYVPLGLLLGAWPDRSRVRLRWKRLAPAVAISALGCALELSQCLIVGRVVDATDALAHAAGGVLGLGLAALSAARWR